MVCIDLFFNRLDYIRGQTLKVDEGSPQISYVAPSIQEISFLSEVLNWLQALFPAST